MSEDIRWMSEEELMKQCRWEAFRGSGPGGQKRNKTSSAVRIVHEPTGISAIASELRSQALNKRRAIQRLRRRLALEIRRPIDLAEFRPPGWWEELQDGSSRPRASVKSDEFLRAASLALDVLQAHRGCVSDAAAALQVRTGQLVAFLQSDSALWAQVARIRQSAGLRALHHRN